MCNFKSAIVLPSGEVVHSPFTDSHEHLIQLAGIKRDTGQSLVRVELLPSEDSWYLRVDEFVAPPWFTQEMHERVEATLRETVERSTIRDRREILVGGAWVFLPGAGADRIVQGRVVQAHKAVFYTARFNGVEFSGNAAKADFRGAIADHCIFANADLSMARFGGASLTGANFDKAWLDMANFEGAFLWTARFWEASLVEATFQGANLRGACFAGANLARADLKQANLQRADLRNANFRYANLEGADLRWVCAEGASFHGAKLDGAVTDDHTFAGAILE